jgi:hypothetical protein
VGLVAFMVELIDMATTVYKNKFITLMNGTEIEILPVKIKYLREIMDVFKTVSDAEDDDAMIHTFSECVRIAMKQFCPEMSKSIEDVEDNLILEQIYDILDFGAGIRLNQKPKDEEEPKSNKESSTDSTAPTWDTLDLAKLEAEVFLLGIWKDYDDLEKSLSMPELLATLESKRELDYSEKKFMAAIQGVDLDENEGKGQKEWEDMKARVFSGGATSDSNDILSLQGVNAQKNGFGIGLGLDYDDSRDPSLML